MDINPLSIAKSAVSLIIEKFLTQIITRHEIAEGEVEFNAVLLEIDRKGRAKSIRRVREFI